MTDITGQKNWIASVIASCMSKEQLESSRLLISNFITQMACSGVLLKTIREIEDELLLCWITRRDSVVIVV